MVGPLLCHWLQWRPREQTASTCEFSLSELEHKWRPNDCNFRSIAADSLVKLDDITSVAKSLGALEPTAELFKAATGRRKGAPKIISRVISDKEAVEACLR